MIQVTVRLLQWHRLACCLPICFCCNVQHGKSNNFEIYVSLLSTWSSIVFNFDDVMLSLGSLWFFKIPYELKIQLLVKRDIKARYFKLSLNDLHILKSGMHRFRQWEIATRILIRVKQPAVSFEHWTISPKPSSNR